MSKSKRIVFTFDAQTLEALDRLVQAGRFETLAEAVRASIKNTSRLAEAQKESGLKIIQKGKDGEVDKELELSL